MFGSRSSARLRASSTRYGRERRGVEQPRGAAHPAFGHHLHADPVFRRLMAEDFHRLRRDEPPGFAARRHAVLIGRQRRSVAAFLQLLPMRELCGVLEPDRVRLHLHLGTLADLGGERACRRGHQNEQRQKGFHAFCIALAGKPAKCGTTPIASSTARAAWHKSAANSSRPKSPIPDPGSPYRARMIRLDNIGKQNGHQILFIEASAALHKGEKVGLVGPNGAGKTTLFRMITGEEQPDEGQVAVDRGVTIGYFSQDVGEMSGRSAVAEVMDGAGPVSTVAAELKELEAAMADPDRADEMDEIIERYGEVQARFEELDGYALEGRAREVLAGLGFSQEMMDGDVGALSGGWKMRVALARILLMRPDAMLLDEPSNHLDLESLIWLEQFLKGYEGALLMTSHDREFMNRIVTKVVEIDGGALTTYSGNYEFYEQQRALNEKQQQAQFERQQAMLAKEIKFIERFKARASHAAQVQSRVKKLEKIERVEPPKRRQTVTFEFPPAPRSGEDVVSLKSVHKGYGSRTHLRRASTSRCGARSAGASWASTAPASRRC